MKPSELEHYLHAHIPISKAMDVRVVSVGEDVRLIAPLGPNINHRDTVFGGSASALAILSAWSLVHCRMKSEGLAARLVIQQNSMNYDRPITGEFESLASVANPDQWQRFVRTHRRKGKARIRVAAVLTCMGEVVGRFEGDFVSLPNS